MGLTAADLHAIQSVPLKAAFECHTQSVERGVATTTGAVKRKRKKSTQLEAALSVVAAREELPNRVTKKRFKTDFASFIGIPDIDSTHWRLTITDDLKIGEEFD